MGPTSHGASTCHRLSGHKTRHGLIQASPIDITPRVYTSTGENPNPMAHERRRAPRCPLIASAGVIDPESDTHLRARLSDLSLVGCYLEIAKPLPACTEVRLNIAHRDATFTADGVIARCVPGMGIGIRFTDVPLDQHKILEQWLAELVRN